MEGNIKPELLTLIPYTMYLTLNHQKLDVYEISRQFAVECYKFSRMLPSEEVYGVATQIKRAALSVHLNIAEGASRRSLSERRRFFEIARGSLVEIDAAPDLSYDLGYLKYLNTEKLGKTMLSCFKLSSGLLKK